MFVKLCGLRSLEDAHAAVRAGADALGFILAESKRKVSPALVASVRVGIEAPPTIVGVTVNSTSDELSQFFETARLDMIQLSGDENISILNELDMPVIKMLRIAADTNINDAVAEVDCWFSHRHAPELLLVEGRHNDGFGGTGKRANWKLMHEIAVRYPIVLAGGLTPDNVDDAIRQVNPIGVDASSGTESDGVKDPEKLTAFVQHARATMRDY